MGTPEAEGFVIQLPGSPSPEAGGWCNLCGFQQPSPKPYRPPTPRLLGPLEE